MVKIKTPIFMEKCNGADESFMEPLVGFLRSGAVRACDSATVFIGRSFVCLFVCQ